MSSSGSSKSGGSNKRQRTKFVIARLTDQEHAALTELAEKRGLSPGALIRQTLLGVPPGPNVRRPTADAKLLIRVLAELGKIGSNINQYTRSRNRGRESDDLDVAMEAALRELLEWRLALMQALGYERHRKPPQD